MSDRSSNIRHYITTNSSPLGFLSHNALVLVELILRAINDDDDDQDGGKGIRVRQMEPVPVAVPSGA